MIKTLAVAMLLAGGLAIGLIATVWWIFSGPGPLAEDI